MTNYCENLLEIEGPEEDVRAFCECLQVDDGILNFHALIPVPEVVLGTHEGVGTRLGTDAELGASALSRSDVQFPFRNSLPILEREEAKKAGIDSFESLEEWLRTNRPEALSIGRRCLEAYRQTGYWLERDWLVAHWGTHFWEGFNIREETPTRLVAEFHTAWAPADKIYHEMARRFRKLKITVSAAEEGNELSYRFTGFEGEVKEEEPGLTAEFLGHVEGSPREVDGFYLRRAELRKEPITHPRYWAARRRLLHSLRAYPVYSPPHDGIEMLMEADDARANFDFFMSQRSARIDALRRFLLPFSVPLDFGENCKRALDAWIAKYGAFLFVRETGSSFLTRNPPWTGLRLGLNVIHDLAIFMGEFAIKESPNLFWCMHLDVPTGLQRSHESFQRPAIGGFQGNPRWHFYPHDRVHSTCHALRQMTYLWKKPLFQIRPRSLNAHFVSMTLRQTYFLARGDIAGADAVMK
jgi:Ferredoxin-like domain in Api92-like protein